MGEFRCAICGNSVEIKEGGNPENSEVICNNHSPDESVEFMVGDAR